jgi:hypothetical protein
MMSGVVYGSMLRCYKQDRSRIKLVKFEPIRRVGVRCEMAASLEVNVCSCIEWSEASWFVSSQPENCWSSVVVSCCC